MTLHFSSLIYISDIFSLINTIKKILCFFLFSSVKDLWSINKLEILYTKGLESPFFNVYLFLEYFSVILIYFLSKIIHLIIKESAKIIKGNLFTGIGY